MLRTRIMDLPTRVDSDVNVGGGFYDEGCWCDDVNVCLLKHRFGSLFRLSLTNGFERSILYLRNSRVGCGHVGGTKTAKAGRVRITDVSVKFLLDIIEENT